MDKSSAQGLHHIVPVRIYLGVAAALFVLTVVTVAVAQINLGGWNVVVALLVAAVKSTLVALIFMHLLYDKKIFLVIFLAGVSFLALFIIFTMFDTMRRNDIDEIKGSPIRKNAAFYDMQKPDSGQAKDETDIIPADDSSDSSESIESGHE